MFGFMNKIIKIHTVWQLISTIRSYDENLYSHSLDAIYLTNLTACELGLTAIEREYANISAMLHDIGKTVWPEYMKTKRNLVREDMAYINTHPIDGAIIAKQLWPEIPDLIMRIIKEHHERPNGSGYPEKITGEEMHPLSQLIAACESFSAMTSERAYRDLPLSHTTAMDILCNEGYDSALLNAMSQILFSPSGALRKTARMKDGLCFSQYHIV